MLLISIILILFFLIVSGFSQRFRGLVARHRLSVILVLLCGAGVFVFTLVVIDYFTVDTCLDSGGRWDKERGVCQQQESPNTP